ncbi:MAG: signal peptidase II [Micrococcales bacterium]|nr:signal peptidase II [Micrococcales bacterium]
MQAEAGASLIDTDPTQPPGSPVSGRDRPRRPALTAVVLAIGALVWGLDQAAKAWALSTLTPGVSQPLFGHVLQLNLLFNPGAAFSLGTNITPVFAAIQAAVVIAVVLVSRRVGSLGWAVGLGLVLGGAAGNLTDRLTRPPGFAHGWVVDFLALPNWPVFNLADSAICTAAVVLAITTFRGIGLDGSISTTGRDIEVSAVGPTSETTPLEEAEKDAEKRRG